MVDGQLSASDDKGGSLDVTRGGAVFIPAGETVVATGDGVAFLASADA